VRIMHLLKHGVRGNGHVHVAVDLACVQADAGHDVTFVSSGGSYDQLLTDHGVRVATIPESGGAKATIRSAASLLKLARSLQPDVLHAHMMSSAVLGFPVAKVVGASLISTMHNSFEKHSILMRLGKVVVAVSEAERRLLLSRGYPAAKVVTVLNGADGSPREALQAEDIGSLARPCVVTLSGLHKRKAVGDVIAAFAEVLPEFPDWHLNIIGWGPDRERLEGVVAELGIEESVHFLGSTVAPRPLLVTADIFASASLADPCPLAVAEARAAGCAIVATAVGGVPEILDHGNAGQLVPASDPAAMAAVLRGLMGDPELLASWRTRARQGSEYFTVTRMARDYDGVYESMLVAQRGPGWLDRLHAKRGRLRRFHSRVSAPARIPLLPSSRQRRFGTATRTPGPDGRVRVAYFVPPSQHFAGIERVVHELASGLMDVYGDVLDVHVLFATDYGEGLLEDASYTLHVLGVHRLRHLTSALRAAVVRHEFEMLICPQIEASVVAWAATRGLSMPFFLSHLHGNPEVEERQGTLRTRIAFQLFRHLISRRISGVLVVSPSLGRYTARVVTRHTPVYFAKNPVRELPGHESRSTLDGQFRLLNVGRLSLQKGQDLLLEALAIARPDLPPVSLTLVGSGPQEDRLRQLSRQLGLDDIVTFAGYTSDPASHFRSADCFVLPSRWEGFGVVLVEALQFGLPLLAADCDFGPADIITDARIGELVAPDSAHALAEGLKRAATRTADSADDAFRRSTADAYRRAEVAKMHFEILSRIATTPARSSDVAGRLLSGSDLAA
jgi:glycosyltransferase involved in cell wall biosynthesis